MKLVAAPGWPVEESDPAGGTLDRRMLTAWHTMSERFPIPHRARKAMRTGQ